MAKCLLDEGIAKNARNWNITTTFWAMFLQVKAANPAHLTTTFCPAVLVCLQKSVMGIKFLAYFGNLLIKNRHETLGQILEILFVVFRHFRNVPSACIRKNIQHFFKKKDIFIHLLLTQKQFEIHIFQLKIWLLSNFKEVNWKVAKEMHGTVSTSTVFQNLKTVLFF